MSLTKAQQRRLDAMNTFMESIDRGVDNTENPIDWEAAADAMALLAPLGRTERWVNACSWARHMIDTGSDPRWAVLQGSIWMGHAL